MNPSRAYYHASVEAFLRSDDSAVLGDLTRYHAHSLEHLQRNAWIAQIKLLKEHLVGFPDGYLFLEFSIPRMGKRADAVLLWQGLIFVIEFKIGASHFEEWAIRQAVDYAVDLNNFHAGSHDRIIIPILSATNGPEKDVQVAIKNNVATCLLSNSADLAKKIKQGRDQSPAQPHLDPNGWLISPYRPTPTIIEAAQALFRGHNVAEISRSEAGAINLSETAECLEGIIQESRLKRSKSICFVTGVPGAGKTLAGLNLACLRQKAASDEHAVFLSGNGPLVDVLREALARDLVPWTRET